jgi:hypothetical protein
MAPNLEFTSAAKAHRGKGITFTVDGEAFECLPVTPGAATADVMMATEDGASEAEQMRAVLQFMDLVLTDESAERVVARLRDKQNPLDFNTLIDIFRALIEALNARPTGGSSGSSPSSRRRGGPSTATTRREASTS